MEIEFTDRTAATASGELADQAVSEENQRLKEDLEKTKKLAESLRAKLAAAPSGDAKQRANTAPTSEETQLLKLKEDAMKAIEKLRQEKEDFQSLKKSSMLIFVHCR